LQTVWTEIHLTDITHHLFLGLFTVPISWTIVSTISTSIFDTYIIVFAIYIDLFSIVTIVSISSVLIFSISIVPSIC